MTAGARTALLVFGCALALRALHLFALRDSPLLAFELGDAASYDAWARRIAAGDWLGTEVFYQAPLYPYFLGTLYALLGDAPLVVRGCQALLGALACALVAGAGARLFGRGAGIAAGLLLAGYAPALFFDALLQKSVLDGLFVALLLFLLAGLPRAAPARRWLAPGLAAGALVLTRENALVLLPVLALWLALRPDPVGARLRAGAACALGLALILAPVALRNLAVGGELHLTTSQLGPNLYIGNHAGATGRYEPLRPGRGSARFERTDATELAERALGRALSPREVSRYWTGRALDWIRDDPGAWLRLLARKVTLLLEAEEAVDTEDPYTAAEASAPLRLALRVCHFGVLAPLALLGVVASAGRWRQLWILHALGASYAASVVLFYVFARYRYPLVPVLALFAGAGLVELPGLARRAGRARLAAALLAAGALAIFSNWPRTPRAEMRAVTHYNLGNAYKVAGDPERALAHYRQALALVPGFAEARHNLADTLGSVGEVAAAEASYRENLRRNPRDAPGHSNLAGLLLARRDLEGAALHYGLALDADPHHPEARYGLGLAQLRAGQLEAAIETLRRLLARHPEHLRGRRALARALARSGRRDEARDLRGRPRRGQPSPDGVEERLGDDALDPEDGQRRAR